ncbi:response regulator [Sandaracinobacteroides saxicola]|uniref:Response regulatory domain-containing protein n=1 Tax=Sandaracinobacteroides saxicola TaxID=2759707 RepID=A0A7G5IEW0_9SPHN|nr:response regulator [Sandaracinobacteroides saxicola]QMW21902.1 hypothetical protein H3309_10955 [Sandaracinobacteroides saxicola]
MTPTALTAWTALIGALTAMVWPLIALGALVVMRKPLIAALQRMGSDGGTIEIFGVKLNVGKATEEQQKLIEDLQRQVAVLRDASRIQDELMGRTRDWNATAPGRLPTAYPPSPAPGPTWSPLAPTAGQENDPPSPVTAPAPMAPAAPPPPAPATIAASAPPPQRRASNRLLWVDDFPDNNAVLVASLEHRGVPVTQVRESDTALAHFEPGFYGAVISDMGRGVEADAGVALTKAIRARDADIPIFIFCSTDAKQKFGGAALAAGASFVTSSTTLLLGKLEDIGIGVW